MKLDGMRRSRMFGAGFAQLQTVQMDYLYELADVRSATAEMYEWRGPPGTGKSLVTVLRQAFGDPRALKDGSTFLYGPPVPLANGALEYPPARGAADAAFQPKGGRTLFTFPDGTWVRVDTWMTQRVRASFAMSSPPLPPSGPDVAWEICAGSLAPELSNVWGVRPDHSVLRFLAGRDVDAEMLFRFPSPALAIRAEGEQRVRCAQQAAAPPSKSSDKGLFSLVPPCDGMTSSVDGPLLRYAIRF